MATFVSADWVAERIGQPEYLVIDPRSAMRYLMGHLRGAVSVPFKKLQGPDGKLAEPEQLASAFGDAGLGDEVTPVLYDHQDGRNAAMAAWTLEYLGHDNIRIMDTFFETWAAQGREKFYRPVRPTANQFEPSLNPGVRALLEDVSKALEGASPGHPITLLDLRSMDEYNGLPEVDDRPGHIPSAVNLAWQQRVDGNESHLLSEEMLRQWLESVAVGRDAPVIAYCRSGIRASVGYLALKQLGYDVRLYDGSYLEWMNQGMPVEGTASTA